MTRDLSPRQRAELDRILQAAFDLPDDLRHEYLTREAADDEVLRRELESLLRHVADEEHDATLTIDEEPRAERHSVCEFTPDIEGLRIRKRIGEGGFGVVFLAEQSRPVRRTVAVKVIKPGMDSEAVIARFEAERQALALMDHANIATILEGGATKDHLPYFVMEHVAGEPITAYCDRHQLTTRERLRLFISVGEAIHYAHQKGIIHRDIKPNNILVTVESGRPVPKVIDFGVAKALNQPLTERSLFTETGQLIGTPEYMSPEQAEMTVLDIDARADVYSLGVLLYELLTGHLPFDSLTLRRAGYGEIQRMIREVDPPKPSTRLSSIGDDATVVARSRRTSVNDLMSTLRAELEWIPLKAMRKDRTERYRSVLELIDDVENYLNDRPLIAGPETAVYRLRKFTNRHRWGVGAAAAMTLVVAAGSTTSGILAWQQSVARRDADEARLVAEDARARNQMLLENAADVIPLLLEVNRTLDVEGKTAARESLLRSLSDYADELPEPLRGERSYGLLLVDIDKQIARLLGGVNTPNLGQLDEAEAHLERAMERLRQVAGADPDDPELLVAEVDLQLELGALHNRRGRTAEAVIAYTLARERSERIETLTPDDPAAKRRVAICLLKFADALARAGRNEEAERALTQSLEIRRALHRLSPESLMAMRDLSVALNRVAYAEAAAGRTLEAAQFMDEVVILRTRLLEIESNARHRRDLLNAHIMAADILRAGPDPEAASTHIAQALRIARRLHADDPADVRITEDIGRALGVAAKIATQTGRPADALEAVDEAGQIIASILAVDASNAPARRMQGELLLTRARIAADRGRLDEADAHFEAAENVLRSLRNDDPSSFKDAIQLAETILERARSELNAGRPARAAAAENAVLHCLGPHAEHPDSAHLVSRARHLANDANR